MHSSRFIASHTQLMGILNVTPDSFSDGALFLKPENAIRHARWLIEDGADIIDVGGESTRPGAEPVSAEEELRRVLPIVEALAGDNVAISIDTMKPQVAAACLREGASIVNDVSGFRNPEMLAVAAQYNASIVIMHMRGEPRTMQREPVYDDLVSEVRDYLAAQVETAHAAGIHDIAIDPGIGFGKTAAHNFELLRRLRDFQTVGVPVLVGPSRKSFLSALPGQESPHQRLEGTIAACVIAAMNGASILRVHDVAECRRALQVVDRTLAAQGGPAT